MSPTQLLHPSPNDLQTPSLRRKSLQNLPALCTRRRSLLLSKRKRSLSSSQAPKSPCDPRSRRRSHSDLHSRRRSPPSPRELQVPCPTRRSLLSYRRRKSLSELRGRRFQ